MMILNNPCRDIHPILKLAMILIMSTMRMRMRTLRLDEEYKVSMIIHVDKENHGDVEDGGAEDTEDDEYEDEGGH